MHDLKLQLETNFFHNQPVSLKKNVEFVSDRLSSNVIKHVRKSIISSSKQQAIEEVKKIASSLEVTEDGEVSQTSKLWTAKKVAHLAQTLTEEIKESSLQFAKMLVGACTTDV